MLPKELRLTVNNRIIACKLWEGGAKPLIALHGWLDNAASFDRLARLLSDRKVLAVDLMGHGWSDHLPEGLRYHMIDYVDDVFAVAQAMGWELFDLIGHSLGAGIATYFAAAFPEKVRKVVFIDGLGTLTTTPFEDTVPTLRKAILELNRKRQSRGVTYASEEEAIKKRMTGMLAVNYDAAKILCSRGVVASEKGYRWASDPRLMAATSVRLTEEQVKAFIQKVTSPALLIIAQAGQLKMRKMLEKRGQHLQNHQRVILPGGHHLHLEGEVDLVASEINKFL